MGGPGNVWHKSSLILSPAEVPGVMGLVTRPGVLTHSPSHWSTASMLASDWLFKLTDDVILEMEILKGAGASQGLCGDALQSVPVETQLLKHVLFTKDLDKHIEIERYIFRLLLVTHYEVIWPWQRNTQTFCKTLWSLWMEFMFSISGFFVQRHSERVN